MRFFLRWWRLLPPIRPARAPQIVVADDRYGVLNDAGQVEAYLVHVPADRKDV